MKSLKILQLPKILLTNKAAIKLQQYLPQLPPSRTYFSSLLLQLQHSRHFMLKDSSFPLISLDWALYTLIRTHAKTIVTSGQTLRKESSVYGEGLGCFQKEELRKMYQYADLPFNLVVYSRMKDEQIKKLISPKHFNYMPLSSICTSPEPTINQIIKQIKRKQIGPTILQNGWSTLSPCLCQDSPVDMLILCVLGGWGWGHGYAGDRVVGVEKMFRKVWESDDMDTQTIDFKSQQKGRATLKVQIYFRKDKQLL